MAEVWKYALEPGSQVLELPEGAVCLTVQLQNLKPMLWVKVDTRKAPQLRVIWVVGTGHRFPDRSRYIGTFQMDNGALVFHVFEEERG